MDGTDFDDFYRATSRRLLSYAYAMTGDMGTAQDLTQEAFVRAGNNPSPPSCPHPGAYSGFVVDFGDGSSYPLPDFGLALACNAVLHGWEPIADLASSAPIVRRAPAPTGTPTS